MGFQSSITSAMGSVAGSALSIKAAGELKAREEERKTAEEAAKIKERQESKYIGRTEEAFGEIEEELRGAQQLKKSGEPDKRYSSTKQYNRFLEKREEALNIMLQRQEMMNMERKTTKALIAKYGEESEKGKEIEIAGQKRADKNIEDFKNDLRNLSRGGN